MRSIHVLAVLLTLAAPARAELDVLTMQPASGNYMRVDLKNWDILGGDRAGLIGFDHHEPLWQTTYQITWQPLDAHGNASFWLPGPLPLNESGFLAYIDQPFPNPNGSGLLGIRGTLNSKTLGFRFYEEKHLGSTSASVTLTDFKIDPPNYQDISQLTVYGTLGTSNGWTTDTYYFLTVQPVPEPTALALLATAATALGVIRRRRPA